VHDTELLLALRAKQFEYKDARLREVVDQTIRLCKEGKEWFNTKASLRTDLIIPGDLVLIKDVVRDLDISYARKLKP
jgi:hypothetical protein